MSYSRIVFYCPTCKTNTHHYQPDIDHAAHMLGVIATMGLWLLGWFATWYLHEPWTCEECGKRPNYISQVRKSAKIFSPPERLV